MQSQIFPCWTTISFDTVFICLKKLNILDSKKFQFKCENIFTPNKNLTFALSLDVTIFSSLWADYVTEIKENSILLIKGRAEIRNSKPSMIAREIKVIEG